MNEPITAGARVYIDPATCIGSGNCVRLAAGALALGDDGVARVLRADAQDMRRLRLAERSCPTGAIFIEEE